MHKLSHAVQPSIAHAEHMQLDIQFIAYLSDCGYTRHLCTCRIAAIHVTCVLVGLWLYTSLAYLSDCGYTRHLRTCRIAAIHVTCVLVRLWLYTSLAYLSDCGYTRHLRTCQIVAIQVNRPSGISQAAALAVSRPPSTRG